ncbi:MAG: NrtA/SsuA/CpmA family ABC transporter substrate-binding protein [Magnetococcales bacterium]|nr:NrtA/SsuA/CpmA family ABC transporter substrate-binding protein [Magnetococcales bacterium]
MNRPGAGRLWWMIGCIVILAIGAVGWMWRDPPERLTIANVELPTVGLLFVAEAAGFYAEENLEVTFKTFSTGRDALAAALKGEADMATVYETPMVINLLKGEPLGIVSKLHQSTHNTALLARRDRGIHHLADLVGKRVGVTFHTNGAFFLYSSLNSEAVELSRVTLVDLGPEQLVAALKSGEVDAVATWNPFLGQGRQAIGPDNVFLYHSDVYTEMSLLAGRKDVIVARREGLTRLLRALLKAENLWLWKPDVAYAMIAQRLNLSQEAITGLRDTFIPILTLDNILLTIMRQEAEWFVASGKLSGPIPDFRPGFVAEILAGVRPEYVTILWEPAEKKTW